MNAINSRSQVQSEYQVQLNEHGQLKHFLSVEGLSRACLIELLDLASSFVNVGQRAVKKVPLLRGKTVVNLFFESSTRTRTTFEIAAKRLSADVINLNISTSATNKGESLLDTLRNLEAMAADMFVIRHQQSGAPHFIAKSVTPKVAVVNAGDGWHAHPTQAMLDMYTIRHYKGDFEQLKVAIVGDIKHSRVARSQIQALKILGAKEIRVVAPRTLLPSEMDFSGVHCCNSLSEGVDGADVAIMLRLQKERMQMALLPSQDEYFKLYGMTEKLSSLLSPEGIVRHPGPLNRGVEIASEVADGPRSVILDQVHFGIAIRMAVMSKIMEGQQIEQQGGAS